MKNTRSTMKLLLLSLTFAAVHFTASPMLWMVQPERLTAEVQAQAIQTLQEQISASLNEQRNVKAGWFGKPKESVEAFFTQNPAPQVLRALFNMSEYGHATHALQNFLSKTNNDPARRNAYNLGSTLVMEACAPAIYSLTNYLANCIVTNRSLMSQEIMDEAVILALMGLVATEQASTWFESNFSENNNLITRVRKAKTDLQAKYDQYIKIALGQTKPDDQYLSNQWNTALQIIIDNGQSWAVNSPLWLALVTFDGYQNLGFEVLTQAQIELFNGVQEEDNWARLEQAIQTVQQKMALAE